MDLPPVSNGRSRRDMTNFKDGVRPASTILIRSPVLLIQIVHPPEYVIETLVPSICSSAVLQRDSIISGQMEVIFSSCAMSLRSLVVSENTSVTWLKQDFKRIIW